MGEHPILWFLKVFGLAWLVSLLGTVVMQAVQQGKEGRAFVAETIQSIALLSVYGAVIGNPESLGPIILVAVGGACGTVTAIRFRKWKENRKQTGPHHG